MSKAEELKKLKAEMEKEEKRYNDIEQNAINNFLDKMDFDIRDWIDDSELEEFVNLSIKLNGSCPICGGGDDDTKHTEACEFFEKDELKEAVETINAKIKKGEIKI